LNAQLRRSGPIAAVAAFFVVVTALVHGWILRLELLGWDSYPLIAAARIDSFVAFLGTFAEELMDGRYPDGHFYRPITHLTFALDHALGGLTPAVYHRTDLALVALTALLVALVARRLVAASDADVVHPSAASALRGWVGPLVAGFVFLVHPLQLEVLPYAPRRADTLALLFTLATLVSLQRAHAAWSFALALLAVGAKETGFLVVPLAATWVLLVERVHRPPASALWSTWPVALAAALVFTARTIVLRGLGGHGESGVGALSDAGDVAVELLRLVLGHDGSIGAALLLAPMALGVAHVLRTDGRRLGWLGCCVSVTLLLTAFSGRAHAWYALLLVVPGALLVALVVQRAVERRRPVDTLVALGVVIACGITLASGFDLRRAAPFERASRLAHATVAGLEAAARVATPGERAVVSDWTFGVPRGDGLVFVHAPYSLAAFVECTAPATPFEVRMTGSDGAPPPLDPAAWQVLLLPPTQHAPASPR
jgi:hypothetical protein